MAAPFWIYKKAHLWHFPEPGSVYTKARACLKNHSRNLRAPLCGIFHPNSVAVARYGARIRAKSPTNCDAHLAENLFQTRSKVKFYFLLFKTFRTIIQMRMVTTISGSVFPTGISILIKIRYSTNPITQITAFVMSTDSLRLSARFSRKKSAI